MKTTHTIQTHTQNPKGGYTCRRCKHDVSPVTHRCQCTDSPSPWEPKQAVVEVPDTLPAKPTQSKAGWIAAILVALVAVLIQTNLQAKIQKQERMIDELIETLDEATKLLEPTKAPEPASPKGHSPQRHSPQGHFINPNAII